MLVNEIIEQNCAVSLLFDFRFSRWMSRTREHAQTRWTKAKEIRLGLVVWVTGEQTGDDQPDFLSWY